MSSNSESGRALKAAFPFTIPILTGFMFLGVAFGIFVRASGFPAIYPLIMSLFIFAGSMEFVAVSVLLAPFDPLGAFMLTLAVNARHLFYGISMLDKFAGLGKKCPFLIFWMCDETFSVNYTATIPQGVDRGWFYLWISLLNYSYWVIASALGGFFGSFLSFNTAGIDFVMKALFIVIFLEQWMKDRDHTSALLGLALSLICLVVFRDNFIIPSMIVIMVVLTLLRKKLDEVGAAI